VQSVLLEHPWTQRPKPVGRGHRGSVGDAVVGVPVGVEQLVPHPLEQQIWPLVQSVLLKHPWKQRPKPVGGGHWGSVGDVVVGGGVGLVVAVRENVTKYTVTMTTTV